MTMITPLSEPAQTTFTSSHGLHLGAQKKKNLTKSPNLSQVRQQKNGIQNQRPKTKTEPSVRRALRRLQRREALTRRFIVCRLILSGLWSRISNLEFQISHIGTK